jgi:hypothetical protein
MIDCRVAKPIRYLGINGLVRLSAVLNGYNSNKEEMKATIPSDSMIKSSISLKISFSLQTICLFVKIL